MSSSPPPPPPPPQPGIQPQDIRPGAPLPPPHQPIHHKLPQPDDSTAGESIIGTLPPADGNVSAASTSSPPPLEPVPLAAVPPPNAPGAEGEVEEGLHADGEVVQQNARAWALDGLLPPGYRFTPQDDELLSYYLRNKILGLPLPVNNIHDVRLYDHNPEDLAATHEQWGEGKWFFFTPRDRKYRNGKRPSRSAGCGYWKATGADKPIRRNGVQVGVRKALVFYRGRPPKGDKTNWIMHEYRINDSKVPPRPDDGTMKLDDWVLCTIHEKVRDAARRKALKGVPVNQREGGRNRQVSGKEAKPPPASPALENSIENSIDVPMMHQALSTNSYRHQSYHSMAYPPLDSIVQETFMDPVFLHETPQNGNGHLLGNQGSVANIHSAAAMSYWPPANELGYGVQCNLPDPVLDDSELMWIDGSVDSLGFADMPIFDTGDHLLSDPPDGYNFDPSYRPFGYYSLPTTDATDSSNFFSSGPTAAVNLTSTAPFETGATCGYGVASETGETSTVLPNANAMDSSNYFFSPALTAAANLENSAPFETDATYAYGITTSEATATFATCGIPWTGSGATSATCGTSGIGKAEPLQLVEPPGLMQAPK